MRRGVPDRLEHRTRRPVGARVRHPADRRRPDDGHPHRRRRAQRHRARRTRSRSRVGPADGLVRRHRRGVPRAGHGGRRRAWSPPASTPATGSACCRAPATSGPCSTTRSGSPARSPCRSTRPPRPSRSPGSSPTPAPGPSSWRPRARRPGRQASRRPARSASTSGARRAAASTTLARRGGDASATTSSTDGARRLGPDVAGHDHLHLRHHRARPRAACSRTATSCTSSARPSRSSTSCSTARTPRRCCSCRSPTCSPGSSRSARSGRGVRLGHSADIRTLGARPRGVPARRSCSPSPGCSRRSSTPPASEAAADGRGTDFDRAADTAIAYSRALDDGPARAGCCAPGTPLFDRLVYARLRAALGGRCRYAVSGGAPLGERLGHFYRGIGRHRSSRATA